MHNKIFIFLIMTLFFTISSYSQTNKEKEWTLYFSKFKTAFIAKNKSAIYPLISKDFAAGGDDATGIQWINQIFSEKKEFENGYNNCYQMIKLSFKSPVFKNNQNYKYLKGKGKFADMIFEYKNKQWLFTGIME